MVMFCNDSVLQKNNITVPTSVLAILPLMILFLFLQRYWQEGLTFGSVKE